MPGKLGVGDQLDDQFDVVSYSNKGWSVGSVRSLNLPNSLPSGDGRCLEALMKGVPSGFLFLVRPGLPCFLETPYTHCMPLAEHLVQIGRFLLHLTFEAAQASQEARSLSLRSLLDVGLGAEVGVASVGVDLLRIGVELWRVIGDCHCVGCAV